MYDALLFDNDGILVEPTDRDVLRRAIREAFESVGVSDPAFEDVEALHDVSLTDVERVCAAYGIEPAPFWRRRDDAASRRQRAVIERGEKAPYPDIEVLDDVDLPIGVVSNNQHETISFVLTHLDLAETVETYYGREHSLAGLRRKKPDPYYLQQALDDLGTRNALYVGDSQKDIVAATEVGLDSAFVRRAHRDGLDLDPEPTFEVEDLFELRSVLASRSTGPVQ